MLRMIETEESAISTATKLNAEHSSAATSTFKEKQKSEITKPQASNPLCGYRGNALHGNTNTKKISTKCPAFGHVCKKCGVRNQFEFACRSKTRNNEAAIGSGNEFDTTETEAISNYVCETKHEESTAGVKENLYHHCFNPCHW